MPNVNLPFPAMFVAVVQKSARSQSNLTGDGTLSSPTIVPVPVLQADQAPGSTAGCPPPFLLLGAPTLSMFPAPDRPRAGWPPPEWNGPKGADRPFWTSNLLPYNRVLRHSPFETDDHQKPPRHQQGYRARLIPPRPPIPTFQVLILRRKCETKRLNGSRRPE